MSAEMSAISHPWPHLLVGAGHTYRPLIGRLTHRLDSDWLIESHRPVYRQHSVGSAECGQGKWKLVPCVSQRFTVMGVMARAMSAPHLNFKMRRYLTKDSFNFQASVEWRSWMYGQTSSLSYDTAWDPRLPPPPPPPISNTGTANLRQRQCNPLQPCQARTGLRCNPSGFQISKYSLLCSKTLNIAKQKQTAGHSVIRRKGFSWN